MQLVPRLLHFWQQISKHHPPKEFRAEAAEIDQVNGLILVCFTKLDRVQLYYRSVGGMKRMLAGSKRWRKGRARRMGERTTSSVKLQLEQDAVLQYLPISAPHVFLNTQLRKSQHMLIATLAFFQHNIFVSPIWTVSGWHSKYQLAATHTITEAWERIWGTTAI